MRAALAEEAVARLSTQLAHLQDWLADIKAHDGAPGEGPAAPAPRENSADIDTHAFHLTVFPEIFNSVYWGTRSSSEVTASVVRNRNRFVSTYAIKAVDDNQVLARYVSYGMNGRFWGLFDHCESYRTHDGRFVLVVSPYSHVSGTDEFAAVCGFTPICPIYQEHAVSLVKIGGAKDFIDYRMLVRQ